MKMLSPVALALALSLPLAVACSSPAGSPAAPSPLPGAGTDRRASLPSITEIAVGNADFSTLVAAVSKAGLVDFFDGRVHYTVFAPTNAAFDAAAASLGYADGPALVAALPVDQLTAILTYHATRGDRNAASVVAAGSLRMLDGNRTTVTVSGGSAYINGVLIAATDIRARNGIVHVIDGVLLP